VRQPAQRRGIDYGLETGRDVVELFDEDDWTAAWPAELRRHYGEAFSIAGAWPGCSPCRDFLPAAGPVGMRSRPLMTVALRVMGNLVTTADRDVVAGRGAPPVGSRPASRPPAFS
jgi:hypothetical protein